MGQDGREDAAVDADGRAGQGQQFGTVAVDGPPHLADVEAAQTRQGEQEQRQAALAQHPQQVARSQLAGGVQLLDQGRLHLLAILGLFDGRLVVQRRAGVGGAQRHLDGQGHLVGVQLEAGGQGVAQGAADPQIELLGQIAGEVGVPGQGRAQGDHVAGLVD